jgi:hypothetical protein
MKLLSRILLFVISLTLILLFFTSVQAQTVYTVNTGGHTFSPRQYGTHSGIETLYKIVTFDSSCLYRLGNEDDADINKLVGWGVGLTSQHSIRIGWNCYSDSGIDLYAYFHYNGKRWVVPKDSLVQGKGQRIGRYFMPNIPISCTIYRARDVISFTVKQLDRTENYVVRFANFPNGWGWVMYPYFGGTSTAPHKMKITIK